MTIMSKCAFTAEAGVPSGAVEAEAANAHDGTRENFTFDRALAAALKAAAFTNNECSLAKGLGPPAATVRPKELEKVAAAGNPAALEQRRMALNACCIAPLDCTTVTAVSNCSQRFALEALAVVHKLR